MLRCALSGRWLLPFPDSVHHAKAKFSLLEIHAHLKNICHILSVTCDNAGTNTFRGASTPAAILAPPRPRLRIDEKLVRMMSCGFVSGQRL
jgi:hypothetical protein